jgi:serine protease 7
MSPIYVTTILGKHDLSVSNEFGSKKLLVNDVLLHPDWNFNAEKFDADISIVVLQREVEFSAQIQPVCIPQSNNDEVIGLGTVVGWGKSSLLEDYDSIPNKLMVPAVNSSHCYTTFSLLSAVSSNRAFCGGFENQGRSPCLGDSGGGFYLSYPSWNVRGIISASLVDFDYGCDINKFTLYTNVARFVDWINKTIEETQKITYQYVDFECESVENR